MEARKLAKYVNCSGLAVDVSIERRRFAARRERATGTKGFGEFLGHATSLPVADARSVDRDLAPWASLERRSRYVARGFVGVTARLAHRGR